jgi:hypothetical protein
MNKNLLFLDFEFRYFDDVFYYYAKSIIYDRFIFFGKFISKTNPFPKKNDK